MMWMTKFQKKWIKILILGAMIIVPHFSCQEFSPVQINEENIFLPAPQNLNIKLGNGTLTLQWDYPDTINVKEFRVYRRTGADAEANEDFIRVGSTKERQYKDTFLANGSRYEYKVSAVSPKGVEGEPSKTVVGMPAIFSLIINDGAQYTNTRRVRIQITAPNNTSLMMLSNDSLFSGAQWEQFSTTKFWDLSFGDGLKTVYGKFRNIDDQELETPVKAQIILDQVALINFLEENSNGRVLQPGDTLHIRMGTGEPNGKASVDIDDISYSTPDSEERNIILFDDGTHGDSIAGDGIYERDYIVRRGLQVEDAFLFGEFFDPAGNRATATGKTRITVQSKPRAVSLFEPTVVANNETALYLRWTANNDIDFYSYQLMRSKTNLVTLTSELVTEIFQQSTVSYVDTGLDPDTRYYYKIYVFDRKGNNSGSNVVWAKTPENMPPKPVVLSQPVPDTLSLILTWSPNTDADFAHYRLYRSTTSPVDTNYAPIAIINDAQITEFRDFSAVRNNTYFYRIFVYDKWGLSSGSNEVEGKIK